MISYIVIVIPTAVWRARAVFSALAGRRDLVVPQLMDWARLNHKVPRSYSDAEEGASSLTELGMTLFLG